MKVSGGATSYDVVIVGLGGIGSAAACWAGLRPGVRVIGLEQFAFDHPHGASDDVSRIIRLSYHRSDYVRLARRAYATWDEVEAMAGVPIVTRTGGLDLFPPKAAIASADYSEAMTREDVRFEVLPTDEVARRWPQWHLPDDTLTLFQADAGFVDPMIANAAHRRIAAQSGVTLIEHARVAGIRATGGELVVETAAGERMTAGRVILAADAWTNDLLATFGVKLLLTITQEQVAWYEPLDAAAFEPSRFPIWIWMDDPSFYGFPTHSAPGPKLGQDVGGREVLPSTRTYEPDPDALARLDAFGRRHLPGLAARVRAKTCLYTLTPDRDFVVDALPDQPGVVVVLGAAHGYKYASVLGRIAVELALDERTASEDEIGRFTIDRPDLREPATTGGFLI
jgi:sarcosine oxidase